MKRLLSFALALILSSTLINFSCSKIVYAATGISVTPESIETKKDEKVYVSTGGNLCYVKYTSSKNRPSVDQMWRIPQGDNTQDFNVPGEWYLHVYVPSTGEWGVFGPYKRESVPPDIPKFQNIPEGKWVNYDVNYNIVCLGDNADQGYDNINAIWTRWASGFMAMEWWDSKTNSAYSYPLYQQQYSYNETKEGWHTEWARAYDKIGNYCEWAKTEFGIDKTPPTLKTYDGLNSDGITINTTGMEDHGLSGNKQLTFVIWKEGGSKVTKTQSIIVEGANATQSFSYSELGGDKNDIYNVEIITEDQVGNTLTYPLTIDGDSVSKGDPKPSDPGKPPIPVDPEDPDEPEPDIPEGKLGEIKFDPNETKWSNKGKTVEGEGKYPVETYFTGDNPYITKGVATIEKEKTDKDGNTKTVTKKKTIPIKFPFDHIDVTKDANDTVQGTRGIVNIEKEGYHLNLHGEGIWGDAEYDEPEDCVDVDYKEPETPKGDSGNYNLDWTKPEIEFNIKDKIFSEKNGAERKPSILGKDDSFYGKVKVKDNLSGVKYIEYKWTYGDKKPSDGYTRIYESENTDTDRSSEEIEKEIEKPVGDNLYLHIKAGDVAGDNTGNEENDNYECFGPYEDPIKLKDFEVTDIRDPRWHDVFWNDDTFNNYKNVTFKANDLPIDESTHPTIRNAYPKKGYAFYFDITSEYLYREEDRIEIKPTFYYLNGTNRTRVDAYYNNNNNPLVQFGSQLDDSKMYLNTDKYDNVLIGNYNKLILTKGVRIPKGREWINGWKDEIQYSDGKYQWWYGKYFIPSSTFFVKAGDIPRPENKLTGGKILINFEIIAYKNGIETWSTSQIFNYTTQQFADEGGPKKSTYPYNYYNGDTIIMNAKYGVDSDKSISVIH
ncbi:hypothetical protein [Clostridium botulinum]|uniref:hypothetical protein n=1 Tax=Clostridium botulinum TaxID=1491 RepID=UPI001C9B6F56|nr:hypothetical protein [Clostridium botulinum]MBY6860819.1 hypothetical protein [Clostridium botulinum]MBY7043859.1 hypothetical protein [Clostridium botulinum]